jgi:adenine-specific DNA-methyltransferase
MARKSTSKQGMGQFFTVDPRVQQLMVSLVQHTSGRAVEPSAGAGHLARTLLENRPGLDLYCVELDSSLPWDLSIERHTAEFLNWSAGRDATFDVVFGNPPYVAWKDVPEHVRSVVDDHVAGWHGKVNLYHLFIQRCAELLAHRGEMVFIVPMDWMFQTATAPLREKLLQLGAITHVAHLGEERVFPDADVPSLCIFRFQRGSRARRVKFRHGLDGRWERRTLVSSGDRWLLMNDATASLVTSWRPLGEQFDVRVGMVTGLDAAFRVDPSTVEPEALRWMLSTSRSLEPFLDANSFEREDDIPPLALEHLLKHRDELLARRIRRFDDSNWWQWGAIRNAEAMDSSAKRFFALAKTRERAPFFSAPGRPHHAAGLLGLFRKEGALPVAAAVTAANSAVFRDVLEGMFLTTNDKLQLQPATLQDAPFPTDVTVARALKRY